MTVQNVPHFYSVFAPLLYSFVEAKRLDGYKYNREVKELQGFDRFLRQLDQSNIEEEIHNWLSKRSNESDKTFRLRNSVYRQFYLFIGKENRYFPFPPYNTAKMYGSGFVPYIFTHDEIHNLFKAIDTEKHTNNAFYRCAPLLFRLLYGTGLRINEALSLLVSDCVIPQGLIIVRNGKNNNTRLVPISDSLKIRMEQYFVGLSYMQDSPVFQSRTGNPLRKNTVYEWYRRVLWKAGIPHLGRGKGPRLHDLRHTFAVHSLQDAVNQGRDINAFLPILSTYLGHQKIKSTEQYLRLTAEAYPSMLEELNKLNASIIPEADDYES